jgi:ribonuclease HII
MDRAFLEAEEHRLLDGLTDSKRLTESRRDAFFQVLCTSPCVHSGVGICSAAEIDSLNILQATHLAMRRAVLNLPFLPDLALVDGRPVPGLPCRSRALIGGDGKSLSVAAASVVAKVLRDRRMRELDRVYPPYGFARHKGYGSESHLQALFEYGPCPEHRRSFRPVREAAAICERSERDDGVSPPDPEP